jgi:hypothetical protein
LLTVGSDLGAVESRVEVVELRDQLVDALRHILALLIGFEELSFQGTDLAGALLQLAPQRPVLAAVLVK